MKKILWMFIPFLCISCTKKDDDQIVKIISVYDGDTFTDVDKNKYRLLGVDTPEMSSGIEFKSTQGLERIYATIAKNFTSELLLNKNIKIQKIKNDIYNRNVVKVFLGNKTLGEILVEKGLARVAYISNNHTNLKYKYAPDYYYDDENYIKNLYDKQLLAAKEKRGFWQEIDNFNIIFPKAK